MNNLMVKSVPFLGTELLAVQDRGTGKVYAGINFILRGLGFNEKQVEYRRDKWVLDKAISKGVLKFSGTLLGNGTGKDTWCIDIMKLPLALAKLEITPKMENEMPELSERLEEYQDKCADVLAEAFLSDNNLYEGISKELQAVIVVDKRVTKVEQRVDKLEYDMPLYGCESDELAAHVKKKGVAVLGGKQSEAYKDTGIRSKVYRDIYDQIKREFGIYDDAGHYRSYKALKRKYIYEAHEMIDCYEPPVYLRELIDGANAQMSMEVA